MANRFWIYVWSNKTEPEVENCSMKIRDFGDHKAYQCNTLEEAKDIEKLLLDRGLKALAAESYDVIFPPLHSGYNEY